MLQQSTPGRQVADGLQRHPREHFAPAEVAFHVEPVEDTLTAGRRQVEGRLHGIIPGVQHTLSGVWQRFATKWAIRLARSAADRNGVRNRAANPTSVRIRRDRVRDRNAAENAEKPAS